MSEETTVDGITTEGDKSITIQTLIGEKEFEWDKAIYMPTGLTGFENHNIFAVANFPDESTAPFKLLQSLTEPELSFIVAPYNPESRVIKENHLDHAFAALAVKRENCAVMFVVTLHKEDAGGEIAMSINLRSPIIIDTVRQVAWQYTLPFEEYPYRRMIGTE
jgi:flagellar assembly factor FliW